MEIRQGHRVMEIRQGHRVMEFRQGHREIEIRQGHRVIENQTRTQSNGKSALFAVVFMFYTVC